MYKFQGSINRWAGKQNVLLAYNGILLSLKMDGNLTHAMTWTTLVDVILSEINQMQKDKHCLSLVWDIYSNQTCRDREQNGGC